MTYSNTNKAKKQIRIGHFLKKAAVGVLTISLVVSITFNIKDQLSNLVEAKKTNANLEAKYSNLVEQNRKLQRQLEYATSSAYKERALRGVGGYGTENDYFIKLNPNQKDIDLYPDIKDQTELPVWKQWWKWLFNVK